MKITLATTLVVSMALGGCGKSVVRPADLSPGSKPTPERAEKEARDYLARNLKDPDSLKQFRVTSVYPKEWQDTRWSPWYSGWKVCFEYNAKNSYGAYPGVTRGGIVLRDDTVIYVVPEILLATWC